MSTPDRPDHPWLQALGPARYRLLLAWLARDRPRDADDD
jgi:hypothetical protein